MDLRGEEVIGVRYLNGNASTATALTLYIAGSSTERTLAATEMLVVTDVTILCEAGGDVALATDSDADGSLVDALYDMIAVGNVAANGGIAISFSCPHYCPRGKVPKFVGAASDMNFCKINGYILRA